MTVKSRTHNYVLDMSTMLHHHAGLDGDRFMVYPVCAALYQSRSLWSQFGARQLGAADADFYAGIPSVVIVIPITADGYHQHRLTGITARFSGCSWGQVY